MIQFSPFKGVNVIGYFEKCLGLGRSARLIVSALEKQSIPFSLLSADSLAIVHPNEHYAHKITNELKYPVNIFCVDPRHIPVFVEQSNWEAIRNCYNISICYWEANRFPKEAKQWWHYLHEIWAPTHYLHEHFSTATSIPVHRIATPVIIPSIGENISKATFNLKERFTFLFYFSFHSTIHRKNPLAIIQAFQKAFPSSANVQLMIKSQNGESYPEQLKMLKSEAEKDARIVWLDQTFDVQTCYELMSVCDCYISLHRSEGFGMTMAEAMLLEKPVIATGYSGNLDFMNEENSYLCSHQLIPIGQGTAFPPDGMWAEVDTDHAASFMKYVFDHPTEVKIKALRGKDYVLKHHSLEAIGQQISRRLNKIPAQATPKSKTWRYQKECTIRSAKKMIKRLIGRR